VTIPRGGDRSTDDPSAAAALAAVASFGLAGSRLAWPARPLGDEAWHELLTGCTRHQLVGLLAAATAAGALSVDRRHRSGLDAVLTGWRSRSARLERDTIDVSTRLAAAGIGHRVVDGPVIAHRAYDPPQRRLYAGVDILVAPGTPRPDLDDLASGPRLRFVTDLLAATRHAGAVAGLGDMPEPHDVTAVAGHPVPSLPATAQLVALAVAAAGQPSSAPLGLLRDVVQLVLGGRTTVDAVAALAERWRVTDPVAAAIRLAWSTLDLADKVGLSAWALRYEDTTPLRPSRPRNGSAHAGGAFSRLWARYRTNGRTVPR
jgi:hypothetical protein